jgi:succinyl-diaminopimelate desuccinylase
MENLIFDFIERKRSLGVELQAELTKCPALSPDSGGEGEWVKAEFLQNWLTVQGFTGMERFDAPDARAKHGARPNLVATLPGSCPDAPRLWIISHLDVVPPGDAGLWHTDPWTLVEKDGKIFGRGVEDNQQGLTASVLAALALIKLGLKPHRTVKLLFAADEECGSVYGIDWLLKNTNLFRAGDEALIPDSGASDGLEIEVAEKNMLWLRVRTQGKQAHASMPELGINAHLAAADFAVALHEGLVRRFNAQNPMFTPPCSTFEPTKREANVPNVNTIPAEDVFYMDMRILPCYTNDEVFAEVEKIKGQIEKKHRVSIELSAAQTHESKATPADAPLVLALSRQIAAVYGKQPHPVGIGGGTVGAFLRNAGMDAVVWSRLDDMAHQPNEYAVIDNILGDAKVMSLLMLDAVK